MIALFTDFSLNDPYVGQLHAVLAEQAPAVRVIDLFHAVPNFDIRAAAYLLPAYTSRLPDGSVIIAVVDPGVGTARQPVIVKADGRWYVGPDNGLFNALAAQANGVEVSVITWQPEQPMPASFHGRDLFAPVAAMLASGKQLDLKPGKLTGGEGHDWPADLAQVIYIDHYGNAITGIRAASLDPKQKIIANGLGLAHARVFAEVPVNIPFWYGNANGLVELAVNQGSAADCLGLHLGDEISLLSKRQ